MRGASSLTALWNNCLSCLFVQFIKVYSTFTASFKEHIDPDSNVSGSFTNGSATINYVSQASSISGYDRHIRLSKASDNKICLNAHYAKHASSSSRVKVILHIDSANCEDSPSSSHAMAMKFDLKYSDANVQTASFFHAGEYDGDGFDIIGSDDDDAFYMKVNIDETSGTPITNAWVLRLSQNRTFKVFVEGVDDSLMFFAGTIYNNVTNTDVDSTGLETACLNDATGATSSSCSSSGHAFTTTTDNFSVTANGLRTKSYPNWTTTTLDVTADASVESYF